MRTSGRIVNRDADLTPDRTPRGYADVRHIPWDTARVRFAGLSDASDGKAGAGLGMFRASYGFGGALYLDAYALPDGRLHFQTAATLDPLRTSYSRAVGPAEQAFFNIQFDLLEAQRRAMARELAALATPTRALAHEIYARHSAAFGKTSRRAARQMLGGRDLEAVARGSAYVRDVVGVDNFEAFGLSLEEPGMPK